MSKGPLQGIRIVEIEGIGPAPFCGMHLADLGADVVLIERKTKGSDPGSTLPVGILKRGKRSIALDLKRPEGRNVALRIAAQSDVVVEQFRPGVMTRLGMDFDSLRAVRSNIILCSLTGYGQTGPLAKLAGHDLNYEAISGLLWMGGEEGRPPPIPAIPFGDMYGAQAVVARVSAALFARERGAGAQHLDVSMAGCMATAGAPMLAGQTAAGAGAPGRGEDVLSGGIAQYGIYETACGGFMAVAALEPKFFALFADRVGRPEWKTEPPLPGAHQVELKRQMVALFLTRTRDEWVELLQGDDCCISPVLSPAEAAAHPHWAANGLAAAVETDAGLSAWVEPEHGPTPEGAPPRLGEHSNDVLAQAGLSAQEIEQLRDSGVIA